MNRLVESTSDFSWEIIGLWETKRKEGLWELRNGLWIFEAGKTEQDRNAKGSGFLVNRRIRAFVKNFKRHSDRVGSMGLNLTGKTTMIVILGYAPTSDYSDEQVDAFYDPISSALNASGSRYNVVMGDLNAKIGTKRDNVPSNIAGKFGIGSSNAKGERLLQFAIEENLCIGNTFFQKPLSRYWTWESPNRQARNLIDHIMAGQRGMVLNCEVISTVDVGSDHRIVREKIMVSKKLARLRSGRSPKPMKIDVDLLAERSAVFQITLQNRYQSLQECDDVDTMCADLTSIVMDTAAENAPRRRGIAPALTIKDRRIVELDEERKSMRSKQILSDDEKRKYILFA